MTTSSCDVFRRQNSAICRIKIQAWIKECFNPARREAVDTKNVATKRERWSSNVLFPKNYKP